MHEQLEKVYYRGKALVVGNDHYDQVKPDLDNAVNDAKSIYDAFRELGFMMMPEACDIDTDRFDELFEDFKSDLGRYEVGVLYFSGHGLEIDGKNYLIMSNTPIGDLAKTTMRYSVDLQACIKELHETKCKMIIVIIDACRNNPLEGKGRGWGSVNLAPLFAPKGTLIAYSTSPGEKADDFGIDGHSVYTGALLKHLKEEGLEIETFFKKVRSTVDAMTGGKKTSWEHTSLIGSFSFNSGKMVHVDDVGYDSVVLRDAQYTMSDEFIAPIIKKLISYNWYEQNEGVELFKSIIPSKLDKNQLFIIGRNMLQAAVGGSNGAKNVISDCHLLEKYSIGGENHLLNGILFEIYFNKDGRFRYKNFKSTFLNVLIMHTNIESLKSSFAFIHELLQGFSPFLIFIPSPEPTTVTINVKLAKEMVNSIWTGQKEMAVVKSISFEGYDLLAADEESNVFPFAKEQIINQEELKSMLCDCYGIPSTYLNLIYNEEPVEKVMWLDQKIKRNYRNGTEVANNNRICSEGAVAE
ncbi:MAG: caspase family protein [Bacteroidales bacterium]|nr:caspase family protein [Bacteroidales bacterium]